MSEELLVPQEKQEPARIDPDASRLTEHTSTAKILGILATLVLAMECGPMAATVFYPATPEIAAHFRTTQVAWGATIVVLTAACLTPLVAKLGDKIGKKKVIVLVMVAALAGSVAMGLGLRAHDCLPGPRRGGRRRLRRRGKPHQRANVRHATAAQSRDGDDVHDHVPRPVPGHGVHLRHAADRRDAGDPRAALRLRGIGHAYAVITVGYGILGTLFGPIGGYFAARLGPRMPMIVALTLGVRPLEPRHRLGHRDRRGRLARRPGLHAADEARPSGSLGRRSPGPGAPQPLSPRNSGSASSRPRERSRCI
jgi:hypothetical protein